jgi:hypothetical protein
MRAEAINIIVLNQFIARGKKSLQMARVMVGR